MAFDLSTARPATGGGFDLSTAKPIEGAAPPEPMTDREAFESHPATRVLRGIEGPAITLLKMVGPDSIKEQLAQIDQLRESGMKKRGNEGIDWMGILGSMVPSTAIAKGISAAVPVATGAGRVLQGAVTGAATSGAQPLPNGQDELSIDKLKQMGIGGLLGSTVSSMGEALKAFLGSNKLNQTTAATLKAGQEAGYTVPPSMVNPSGLNNTIESLAGKDAVKQAAAARNQGVTDRLAAQAIGLPTDQPIMPASIGGVRDSAGNVYEQVAQLSPNAKWALGELRQARHDSNVNWNYFNKSGNPEALTKAQQAGQLSDLLENEIQREAQQAGRPELVKGLADARMKIAKAYNVENALGEADSHVSAPIVGRSFDKKGGKAITGELATIGKMAEAFSPVMREGAKVPVAGVSGTDAIMSGLLGGIGLGTSGPLGVAAAGLPWIVRPAARNLVLSPMYHKYIAEGIPARYIPLLDAMNQQSAGAAGAAAGRNY